MFPTPDLSHLTKEDKIHVYDPAEDTFLLLDGLEQEADVLRGQRPLICLEIGTGERNKILLDPITCDLAQPLMMRLRHSVDIILFNPPYVATETEEALSAQVENGISGSWAGGANGMEITNRFLTVVEDLLSDRGKFYLVALEQNNIPEIRERMSRGFNLQSEKIVTRRRAGREFLHILRFSRRIAGTQSET
ncbi:hypothetical protein ID866_1373 [Astraeus odoratus]|nr:hypothetical protein ID866_1373 [Astraeus odoratus]